MSTDYRALCAELNTWLVEIAASHMYLSPAAIDRINDVTDRTHIALKAEPEPVAPAIEPVPVSERLPEPEDCDAEGGCWWWHPDHKEDDFDDGWILLNPKWAGGRRDSDDSLIYTHWLPANALPTPEATNA